jgi:erythromycin esterase
MAVRSFALTLAVLFSLPAGGLDLSSGTRGVPAQELVSGWLREHAFPLQRVEPGNGFGDLKPLRQWLRDVRFVGLGETTHGTREFFQVKHRLLEFLVSEMGFRAFALESSVAACTRINEYVVDGKGDLGAVVSGQGYVAWDTEEFTELVRWLRAYNQSRPPSDRVRFYGLDLWNNEVGRDYIVRYLRTHARDELSATEDLFARLATLEKKWPMQLTDSDRATLKELVGPVAALTRHLASDSSSSDKDRSREATRGVVFARVMEQWVMANAAEARDPRSEYMANNLEALAAGLPGTKFVFWAHDGHVRGRGRSVPTNRATTTKPAFGEYMRRAYGDQYFALGVEFNEGAYRTRELVEGEPPGDFRVVTVPAAPERSVPWHLSALRMGNLVVNLRGNASHDVVHKWLSAPQVVHDVWWGYLPPENIYAELPLRPYYDGIVFIERTTATRPTAAAEKAVAERAAFRF